MNTTQPSPRPRGSVADDGMFPADRRMVALAGGGLIAAFTLLAWQSHRTLSPWSLLVALTLAWSALGLAWRMAANIPAARLLPTLWIVAVALRAIGFWGAPVFEDDWHRYLWDGRQLAHTGNPYDISPRTHFRDESLPDSFQDILSNINHPDVPTIYGPVCQYLFALGYWMAPGQLWPVKLLFLGADLLALGLLLKVTSPRQALLFAWCPLVIHETAFNAHVEILGVVFLVAAFCSRNRQMGLTTAVLCACAVAARIHAVLLVPFLLWPLNWRSIATFLATLALLYAPFWMQGSAADFVGLKHFLGEWEFNSSLFAIVKGLAGWTTAKLICNALFVVAAFATFAHFARNQKHLDADRTATVASHALVVLAAFFSLSAVVNPWYLLWLAPFVALRPSLTALVAMAAVSLSYLHGGTLDSPGLPSYHHPEWVRPLEYGLILAAACFEWRRNLLTAKRKAR